MRAAGCALSDGADRGAEGRDERCGHTSRPARSRQLEGFVLKYAFLHTRVISFGMFIQANVSDLNDLVADIGERPHRAEAQQLVSAQIKPLVSAITGASVPLPTSLICDNYMLRVDCSDGESHPCPRDQYK